MKHYLIACIAHARSRSYREYRIGQTLFNTLYELRPELADNIRSTEYDPYYSDSFDSATVKRFLEHLENQNIQ